MIISVVRIRRVHCGSKYNLVTPRYYLISVCETEIKSKTSNSKSKDECFWRHPLVIGDLHTMSKYILNYLIAVVRSLLCVNKLVLIYLS